MHKKKSVIESHTTWISFNVLTRVTKSSYKPLNLCKKLAFLEVGNEYAISSLKATISDFTL